MARPTVMTREVVALLEHSIMDGATISEACRVAKISRDAYYDELKDNKVFSDKMANAEEYPTMVAKKNVIDKINKKDIETSKWWLERKNKKEFSLRVENTGADGSPLLINDLHAATNTGIGVSGISGQTETSTPDTSTT